MGISRREFLIVSSALACGCQQDGGGGAASVVPHDVVAGSAEELAAGGAVSARFRDQGFFLVRQQGGKVVALSSICTHRNCKLDAAGSGGFVCRCHGSEFDEAGRVLTGPAKRDLPVYATSVDEGGRLIVHVR